MESSKLHWKNRKRLPTKIVDYLEDLLTLTKGGTSINPIVIESKLATVANLLGSEHVYNDCGSAWNYATAFHFLMQSDRHLPLVQKYLEDPQVDHAKLLFAGDKLGQSPLRVAVTKQCTRLLKFITRTFDKAEWFQEAIKADQTGLANDLERSGASLPFLKAAKPTESNKRKARPSIGGDDRADKRSKMDEFLEVGYCSSDEESNQAKRDAEAAEKTEQSKLLDPIVKDEDTLKTITLFGREVVIDGPPKVKPAILASVVSAGSTRSKDPLFQLDDVVSCPTANQRSDASRGVAFKGTFHRLDVAIKSFQKEEDYDTAYQFLSLHRHPNIVNMFGWCRMDERFCVVEEFAPLGDFEKWIKLNQKNLRIRKLQACLLRILKDVAAAIFYLQSRRPDHTPLLINPRKILLFGALDDRPYVEGSNTYWNLSAKISDAVVSTKQDRSSLYAAPELAETGTLASATFSFGLCCLRYWRISNGEEVFWKKGSVTSIVNSIPHFVHSFWKELIEGCCKQKPEDRWTPEQILAHLDRGAEIVGAI
eukprot:TRINITY_DN4381_c0_g1_i1.p1 TRINITY_DN4381_c0_g1~~TRINITY_DN4381_c0_g1_i1.p1  ORF type:complete len:537 (+),score=118.59 TRINITY_DN4381_c0_g1_i1:169-1779(+)